MKFINCSLISKKYDNNIIFNNFSCEFNNQLINFITGVNGVGKSTLIACFLEFIKYEGKIEHNLNKIVYQPERVILPDYIKLIDYLILIGQVHHEDVSLKLEKLLKKFDLEKVLFKELITLSKGTRQKVLIIQSLMLTADAYIFDEPLSGLDPLSQKNFVEEINRLYQEKKLIIIITHFMEQYNLSNTKIINLNDKDKYEIN